MSRKLKNILAFLDRGVPILPLTPEANAPGVAGGAQAAVTDPRTLTRFYTKNPKYGYGLALGDGVFVIRASDNRAKSRLHKLAGEHGQRLPKTATLRIDKERLYLVAAKTMQIRSSKGLIGNGIDVLGTGEYVPGPGSSLPTGGKSRFARGRALSEVEIATCPSWLAKLIGAAPADQTPVVGSASNAPPPTGRSGWDENLVRPPERSLVSIPLSAIAIDTASHVDPEHLRLLEDSIAVLGIRTPITVVPMKRSGNTGDRAIFEVVTGHARLNALRNRGATRVDAFVFDGDEVDAKLWAIAENVDRRVRSVIEIAHDTTEFDRLLCAKLEKVVQDAPRGGVQPGDRGIRAAARRLGITRETIRRRRLISELAPEALAEAKTVGLDKNQTALVDAAKEKTSARQVSNLRARAARKVTPRRRQSNTLSSIQNASEVEQLKNELAAAVEHRREVEEELESARTTVSRALAVGGSVRAPTGDDIPVFLDRRPLSPKDQLAFDAVMAAWAISTTLRTALVEASAVVQERFIAVFRADISSSNPVAK